MHVALALLGVPVALAAQANEPRFDVTSHLLRFWSSSGAPIAVVPFAMHTSEPLDTTQAWTRTFTMTLRQAGAGAEVRDTNWRQDFDHSTNRLGNRFASGFVVVSLAPWLTSWSLTATSTSSATSAGGVPVAAEPLPLGSVMVSDLALGVPADGDTWQLGDQRVSLAQSDTFSRKAPVHVSYQVLSEISHDDVRTSLTLTDVTDPARGKRVLQVNFPGRLAAGVNFAERELDMSKRKSGRYQLELQVADQHGGGTSVRRASFTVK